jgi:hypothetical protein
LNFSRRRVCWLLDIFTPLYLYYEP